MHANGLFRIPKPASKSSWIIGRLSVKTNARYVPLQFGYLPFGITLTVSLWLAQNIRVKYKRLNDK